MGRSFEQGGPQGAGLESASMLIRNYEEDYGKREWG
jgi:hypothetical protein